MQGGRKYTRKNSRLVKHQNRKHTKSLRRKSHNKNKVRRSRRMKGGG